MDIRKLIEDHAKEAHLSPNEMATRIVSREILGLKSKTKKRIDDLDLPSCLSEYSQSLIALFGVDIKKAKDKAKISLGRVEI